MCQTFTENLNVT